jgi:hypothetical protein
MGFVIKKKKQQDQQIRPTLRIPSCLDILAPFVSLQLLTLLEKKKSMSIQF